MSVSGLHYDPSYYPDPHKFDPNRFLNEKIQERHQFCYLPFGEGPRRCIGTIWFYTLNTIQNTTFFRKEDGQSNDCCGCSDTIKEFFSKCL